MRRLRRASAALAATLVMFGLSVDFGYADHHPTLSQVKHRVDRLNHEAEQASERLNTSRERLARVRGRLDDARADFARQRVRVTELDQEITSVAVAQYEGNGLSTTVQLLAANNPNQFLAQLATVQTIDADRRVLLTTYIQERRELASRAEAVAAQEAAAAAEKQRAAKEKESLDKRAAAAKALLSRLKEKQRQRLLRQQRAERRASIAAAQEALAPSPPAPSAAPAPAPAPAPTSGSGAQAVAFALAQVGDPYVYGAAGPDAWDCSGLTMGAWAAAGVALPHSASMQYSAGTPVSTSALAPGDLVFYYSPISHVALYIGNGQVVHAPHPGSSVEIVPMSSMPIAGAVRPG